MLDLRSIFDLFDIDSSGGISFDEIISALPVLGINMTKADAAKMFKEADAE